MDKERVFSIIRYFLSALGAYLLGKNLFGQPVDDVLWQQILGALMALVSIVWGFVDKTVTLEGFQGAIRQVFAVAGGLAVSAGVITAESVATITGIIITVSAWVYSYLSTKKTMRLVDESDPLEVHQLSGARRTLRD